MPQLPVENPAPLAPSEWERISIQVDDPFLAEVDAADLIAAITAALSVEEQSDAELTLVITNDEAVASLNLQYRGIADPTDVLSFAAQEPAEGFVSAPGADTYLGDIIIAFPFTQRQAAALGRPMADELRLLAVHGVLHLLGYDHAEPDEGAVMWARQDLILARFATRV